MKNIGGVQGEAGGECGGEARVEDEEGHPPVEKCGARAEAFAEVDVSAAGSGKSAGEFTVAERAAESGGADREPDDEEPKGRGERFRHACRREEDADGDGFSNNGGGG